VPHPISVGSRRRGISDGVSASELRAAKPLAQRAVSNLPAGDNNIITPAAKSPLNAGRAIPTVTRAGGFPKVPAPSPPCVLRSPAHFSARSQHTQRPDRVWWFCRPSAIGAFQRPSSQRLLFHYYWSPSGFRFCCRGVPSGCVQRTGCSACGLGYPHQVWWAPPMYIARAWPR
jgi:hypothetical protein